MKKIFILQHQLKMKSVLNTKMDFRKLKPKRRNRSRYYFKSKFINRVKAKSYVLFTENSWSGFASGSFCFLFSTNPTSRKWIETRQLAWSRTKIKVTNVSTHLCYNRASKPWKAGFATGGRELKFISNWSAVQSVQLCNSTCLLT